MEEEKQVKNVWGLSAVRRTKTKMEQLSRIYFNRRRENWNTVKEIGRRGKFCKRKVGGNIDTVVGYMRIGKYVCMCNYQIQCDTRFLTQITASCIFSRISTSV